MVDPPPVRAGLIRGLLFVSGVVCTVLAAAGAFLPVLPTTPFLLVAAACFVRSSPSFHRRLLANRVFGPYVAQWQANRTLPRAAKRKAYGLVIVTFTLSIFLFDALWMRVGHACLGGALLAFLVHLPTSENGGTGPRGKEARESEE